MWLFARGILFAEAEVIGMIHEMCGFGRVGHPDAGDPGFVKGTECEQIEVVREFRVHLDDLATERGVDIVNSFAAFDFADGIAG